MRRKTWKTGMVSSERYSGRFLTRSCKIHTARPGSAMKQHISINTLILSSNVIGFMTVIECELYHKRCR